MSVEKVEQMNNVLKSGGEENLHANCQLDEGADGCGWLLLRARCDQIEKMSSENLSSPASETVEAIEDPGKMFIGGLSWQTSVDSLRQYFMQFGEVTESVVMRDPNTKKARGFGFIKFADAASVDKVLNHQAHELDGKKASEK
ncbi:RNA-binding protein Musashi -like protein 2 [Trichinella nelsoni]|uniref:RNA-binding protein Musashi-like protein 2 n=4 Tax=Trichinella TaxID=6333 RepID=A0A0V0SKV1_9BILA|nr:RNA-binding protein Musashi -like protein 2 [Trichinella nelsoni]